ncbi:FeoA domain-containing protein [Candidatus Sumerlaeota bacterium]|nr:FeoA domain-containing protein [Candidatus Sumerlaeota bacterium]
MNNITKESDVLRIVKEDILRFLGERNREVSIDIIKDEIKVIFSLIFEAIGELEKEELIDSHKDFYQLNEKGKTKARDILRKHQVFEDYFKKTRSEREAHEIAHILEHYVSREVTNNIIKLSTFQKDGVPLTDIEGGDKRLITDIMISADTMFERLVSMGILPGEDIILISRLPNVVIVNVGNKKYALDKDIANKIKVLKDEES